MAKRETRRTKERILEAALAVFTERGYRAASIDEIAARAGLTKGAVYYWFEDKDDLALDLHHRLWERLAQEAGAGVPPGADMITTLEQGFEAFLHALRNVGEARFFLRDLWGIPVVEAATRGIHEQARAMVRAFLEEGIKHGEIARLEIDAMAHVLVGVYNEATLYVLTSGDEDGAKEVVRRLVRALAAPNQRARAVARS